MNIHQLQKNVGLIHLQKLITYTTVIETTTTIDYLFFVFDNELEFGIEISNSAEGMCFVTKQEINQNIERTQLIYLEKNILKKEGKFIGFNFNQDDANELKNLTFLLEKEKIEITLGMDCFIINQI